MWRILLVVILGLNSAVAAWYYLRMAAAALIDTRPSTMYAPSYNRLAWRAGAAPAWLLSHPKSEERIAAIEANEAKWSR